MEVNDLKFRDKNKIFNEDCLTGLENIPKNSIDLVIVDPPYFKTVNQSWDYEWKTKDEYISWCRKWLDEVERVSKINASFYLFGYSEL